MSRLDYAASLESQRGEVPAQGQLGLIAAADERNIAMVFTGTRHFRH